ncbi:hypothetical protein [Gymnodinialimonas hymeniacidonis]|uniref:hypothetical protein n=1 Tax=Gymnodinialimonas hymeniacidonis TaxID=3126508 RepID=UPI0034C67CD5
MRVCDELWNHPHGGTVPDLADLLQAETVAELSALSGARQDAAASAMERQAERSMAEARAFAADLKAKGIAFDVDRVLRPSLWERLQDKWDEWRHGWTSQPPSAPSHAAEDQLFAFDLPLALTFPPRSLSLDYETIDTEVMRLTDALARQITAQRGRGPLQVAIPDDVYDEIAEEDEWSEVATIAYEADCAVGYWPPNGQPALLLSVVQEDPEHVIEVKLLAHGGPAHRRFVAELEALGGSVG